MTLLSEYYGSTRSGCCTFCGWSSQSAAEPLGGRRAWRIGSVRRRGSTLCWFPSLLRSARTLSGSIPWLLPVKLQSLELPRRSPCSRCCAKWRLTFWAQSRTSWAYRRTSKKLPCSLPNSGKSQTTCPLDCRVRLSGFLDGGKSTQRVLELLGGRCAAGVVGMQGGV